ELTEDRLLLVGRELLVGDGLVEPSLDGVLDRALEPVHGLALLLRHVGQRLARAQLRDEVAAAEAEILRGRVEPAEERAAEERAAEEGAAASEEPVPRPDAQRQALVLQRLLHRVGLGLRDAPRGERLVDLVGADSRKARLVLSRRTVYMMCGSFIDRMPRSWG